MKKLTIKTLYLLLLNQVFVTFITGSFFLLASISFLFGLLQGQYPHYPSERIAEMLVSFFDSQGGFANFILNVIDMAYERHPEKIMVILIITFGLSVFATTLDLLHIFSENKKRIQNDVKKQPTITETPTP